MVRGRPRRPAALPLTAARRAAGATVVLVSVLLAGCGNDRADVVTSEASSSAPWPWETSPPTASGPADSRSMPRSIPSAVVTLEPGATESPEPDDSSSPSPSAEPSPSPSVEPSAPPEPSPGPDESDEPEEPDDRSRVQQLEAEVVELVNDERAGDDCPELHVDERLEAAAGAHSADMAERNYFDHTSPEGEEPGERAREAGYERWSGENIAMGYPTAEAVVGGWMDSPGHRANILNCDSAATGVGVADSPRGLYWTQMFGYE